jgi:Glycosyl hydrolases family 2
MTNHIRDIRITQPKWDPARAELLVTVTPDEKTPTTEVRGRLMGPRCLYSSTVEVAYPLRPTSQPVAEENAITMRVLIPEASLWEPQCPFLYEGHLELWQEGTKVHEVTLRHGMRLLQLGPRGLRLNGHPFTIQGVTQNHLTDAQALRQAGINTLLAPVDQPALWDEADRLGFFMIGKLDENGDLLQQALALRAHPSCLARLIPQEWLHLNLQSYLSKLRDESGQFMGMLLDQQMRAPLPADISFVACSPAQLSDRSEVDLPKLFLEQPKGSAIEGPGIMGWVSS